MPKDKKPFERYQRIHEMLSTRSGTNAVVKSSELMAELNISLRQLRKDMDHLKNQGAPLEYVPTLYGWRYPPGHQFTFVDRIPLTSQDVILLRVGFEMLAKTGQLASMEEAKEAFGKIHRAVRKWVNPKAAAKPIYFDPLPHYEGGRHLTFFLRAIEECRRVEFQYRSFRPDDPGKTVLFDPWFLRHYDRRWYVGGFSHDPAEKFVRVFPLERMEGEPRNVGYCHDKPRDFDAETYWRHIYGITVPKDGKIEPIVLEFSPPQDQYFLSTPFFEPFEVQSQTPERLVIQFSLMVNVDLINKLASLGAGVRVLAPAHLAASLQDFFQHALRRYED
jgi:predicted DNA-binding transcriptional regulator YafY